jgi:hypothetical protein
MKWISLFIMVLYLVGCSRKPVPEILRYQDVRPYIDQFNADDDELYVQHIPNDSVHAFLEKNIPLLDIPDEELEKIYYFRWWTYRKHIKSTEDGFVITEFLPDVGWAGKHNTINCPAAHHIYEGRWLRDDRYLDDYLHFWLTAAGKGVRSYSFWIADAMLAYGKVNRKDDFIAEHLPLLVDNYNGWEAERRDAPDRLFWQIDDRDGMEYSASGRILNGGERTGGMAAVRPTINSYMYGDARAIATLAALRGEEDTAAHFEQKATQIKEQVQDRLWNDSLAFFTVLPRDYDDRTEPLDVRELIGYTPWYFNLPDDRTEYARAWEKLLDTTGFYAPYGLTVCERAHPFFEIRYEGHQCQWNGPSWPFATTQTLKAMARFINEYQYSNLLHKEDYYQLLRQYARSHSITFPDGKTQPWIDENLNPFTGDWISRTRLKTWENGAWSEKKGGRERGKDYNHSGFCDLVISDLIGLKPQLDDRLVVEPLLPDIWDWFCLDKIRYHGRDLTILWDRTGARYGRGRGFKVLCDGREIFVADEIRDLNISLPDN